MKRLIAISFLCLLLFNIAGYRLWFYYAERQATAQLEASVDQAHYDSTELITLTVPLTLPYQTDWQGWEKVRGEVEIDGIVYQYVQRKVTQGQLVLQCLPNKQRAQLASARDRFFELANSFQSDNGQQKQTPAHALKITKPSLTDFDDHWSCWRLTTRRVLHAPHGMPVSLSLPAGYLPLAAQPPEAIA